MIFPTGTVMNSSFWVKSMALVGQNFSQALQVPFWKKVQLSWSMTGYFGTACANLAFSLTDGPAAEKGSLAAFGGEVSIHRT